MKTLALLFLATCAAVASPVVYTFAATTRASAGSPAHNQTFELIAPDFIPVADGGPLVSFLANNPALVDCTPCEAPPVNALHFLRSGASDLLQFLDQDGTTYLYDFPVDVFSTIGTFQTKPGINVGIASLKVTATPEPSTMGLGFIGVAALAALHRRRRDATALNPGRPIVS